eukprot:14211074-Alexandrium_andersonii.AAC.1
MHDPARCRGPAPAARQLLGQPVQSPVPSTRCLAEWGHANPAAGHPSPALGGHTPRSLPGSRRGFGTPFRTHTPPPHSE